MRSPAPVATAVAAAVLLLVAAVGAVAVSSRSQDDVAGPAGRTTTFGLLAPTPDQVTSLAGSAVTRVTVGAVWSALEPDAGRFDDAAVSSLTDRISKVRALDLDVVLDLGLQYPPAWVLDVGDGSRFVDQYGDVWHGELSEDVPNAVFDHEVRAAQARYVTGLGARLRGLGVTAVRVGGLLRGELRYPPSDYRGHDDCLWAFDPTALAASPDPAWRPGRGSEDDARRVLTWYLSSLTDYLRFLLDTVSTGLPGLEQQVLLPSWGIRPGMVDQAVATRFGPETPSDVADLVASGLDWPAQIAVLASRPAGVTAYTTWLDAPDHGDSARTESPVAYLAALTGPVGVALGGENTGGGGLAAWTRARSQAQRYGLHTVMYMSGNLIASGDAGVTLPELTAATR